MEIHGSTVVEVVACAVRQVASMFLQLFKFADCGLLLLRIMVGIVFVHSGWSHLKNPEERSKSIGMSKSFTAFLGAAELAEAWA